MLELPARIHNLGLVLEVVILYIPMFIELDQIEAMGNLIANADKDNTSSSLPEYRLSMFKPQQYRR
ncbi:MAG: hypothetical protein QXM55_01400 [Ignisphaera sp.]